MFEYSGESVDANGCSQSQLDNDGDGVSNLDDDFPNDASRWSDNDGDGYSDQQNDDLFPNDASRWSDSDGDGYSDQQNDDAFQATQMNGETVTEMAGEIIAMNPNRSVEVETLMAMVTQINKT